MADYLNEELDRLIAERNNATDANDVWKLDCEIENCVAEMGV